MQQYLPFTVLKLLSRMNGVGVCTSFHLVATVLTVYGIETVMQVINGVPEVNTELQQYLPFTVLKHIV